MTHKKRITIKDVARFAGVSNQTVSRVINNRPDVAEETRQRVKEVIKLLNYRPDPIARSMKGITQTIGCITPNLRDYNFACIVEAAQNEAREYGYFILTGCAQNDFEVPPLLQEIMNRRVDGLLVINPRDDNRYRHLRPLIDQGIPVMYLKDPPDDEPASSISLDDVKGGYLAGCHFQDLGHRIVVDLMGPESEQCSQQRSIGFYKAFEKINDGERTILSIHGDWSAASGEQAIQRLLAKSNRFSAIFAHNDRMASGAIRALRKAGLKVPQEVSIIGYDDDPFASFLDPPLTTIRQPFSQIGKTGLKKLIEQIQDPSLKPVKIVLEPRLIFRDSCLPFSDDKDIL